MFRSRVRKLAAAADGEQDEDGSGAERDVGGHVDVAAGGASERPRPVAVQRH